MSTRAWQPSKAATFGLLMTAALITALLPDRATEWMRGVAQPLSYLQMPVRWVTLSVLPTGARAATAQTSEEARLRAENDALRRQVATLDTLLRDVDGRLAAVTGFRDQFQNERTRIVIARVVGPTGDTRRDVLRITKGSLSGVRVGMWVAAGSTPTEGVSGRDLLAREWLIGRVSEVRPYESLVRLASDRGFKEPVLLARIDETASRWEVAAGEQVLYGHGDGKMRIELATQDYFKQGQHAVLAPASGMLPMTMPLGEITASRTLDATQLHYDLEVRPLGRPFDLTYAYIIDPGV